MPDRPFDRRQGFLVSATIHLMLLTLLAVEAKAPARAPAAVPPSAEPEAGPPRRVLLLPPRLLRPETPSASVPPARDRISIGQPSALRADRLLLERDKDLTSEPAGPGGAPKAGLPGAGQSPNERSASARAGTEAMGTSGPGLSSEPRGSDRPRSIGRSLAELDRRLGQMGSSAVQGGAGRQMGPLFFDPEGADFTGWINHFKNEVYRNWIVPQAARFGFRGGHVDFEFWVERDGRMTDLRMLKSSGTPALDRAAQNALIGSRLLPLPADYRPPRVNMQVSFYYNEEPRG